MCCVTLSGNNKTQRKRSTPAQHFSLFFFFFISWCLFFSLAWVCFKEGRPYKPKWFTNVSENSSSVTTHFFFLSSQYNRTCWLFFMLAESGVSVSKGLPPQSKKPTFSSNGLEKKISEAHCHFLLLISAGAALTLCSSYSSGWFSSRIKDSSWYCRRCDCDMGWDIL